MQEKICKFDPLSWTDAIVFGKIMSWKLLKKWSWILKSNRWIYNKLNTVAYVMGYLGLEVNKVPFLMDLFDSILRIVHVEW